MPTISDISSPLIQEIFTYLAVSLLLLILFFKTLIQFSKTPIYKPMCIKLFPFLSKVLNKCFHEVKKDIDSISLSNKVKYKTEIKKSDAYISMSLLVILSAGLFLSSFSFLILGMYQSVKTNNSMVGIVGIIFFAFYLLISYWYKGCAYRVARESKINLTPWIK